jgi:hypothetical protein
MSSELTSLISLFITYAGGQGVPSPTLAIVAQGSKELMLGNEAFACGVVERISGCAPAE